MDAQLFVSENGTAPTAEKMEPINNGGDSLGSFSTWSAKYNKPLGGLWTSTRTAPGRSAWIEWCLNMEYTNWITEQAVAYALTVKPDARVFTVASRDDVARLPRTLRGCTADMRPMVDFEALAAEWDGLHIVDPNIGWSLFRDWDIESTVWFRWSFERVTCDAGALAPILQAL